MGTPDGWRAPALLDAGTAGPVPAVLRQPGDVLGPRAQRTIAKLLDATREVFLQRGYAATAIDEIARTAGVSRASFYTYFPTKRDVLLAVGARSARGAEDQISRLATAGSTRDGLRSWVHGYFRHLDLDGSFAFAWTQAAHEDSEIRAAGTSRHLQLCARLGEALGAAGGEVGDHPDLLGLAVFSALERAWSYCRLYAETVDRTVVEAHVADMIWAAARPTTSGDR